MTRPTSDARIFIVIRLLAVAAAVAGCATPVVPHKVTVNERIEFDRKIGREMAAAIEPHLEIKHDHEVSAYLDEVGQALAAANPDLHLKAVRVAVIGDRARKWQDFAVPGGRFYISSGLLKSFEFDNEIAAALALELARLQKEYALNYLRKQGGACTPDQAPCSRRVLPPVVDYFGARGLFAYDEKQDTEAIAAAVDILYLAGYDPRGLVTLWQRYEANLSHSPYPEDRLDKMIEETRRTIALHSPLRNPIVRSQAFLAVRNRIQKL